MLSNIKPICLVCTAVGWEKVTPCNSNNCVTQQLKYKMVAILSIFHPLLLLALCTSYLCFSPFSSFCVYVVTSDGGLFFCLLSCEKGHKFVCVVGPVFDSMSPTFGRSRASQVVVGTDIQLAGSFFTQYVQMYAAVQPHAGYVMWTKYTKLICFTVSIVNWHLYIV